MAFLNSLSPEILVYILAGGILPTVFWLWFWLREDAKKPEPRGLLLLTFFVGALSVVPTIYLESLVQRNVTEPASAVIATVGVGLITLMLWSVIEETVKYLVAWIIDFHNNHFDEPVDAMIYLITASLGFACFENILFIIKGVHDGGLSLGLTTIAMRFLGATLLHVLASATLGGILALSYCKSAWTKRLYTLLGLCAAIVLHVLFNYFILTNESSATFSIFFVLWLCIVALLLFFEKVKKIVCTIKP